ncbi:MAG: LLM class F420-dependent oxidoreductase [Gammaproteobacteria bacterium]|nr:LLM class F420-dependent oxidoreductase [Gammaproteobacteria bacterium]
MKIGFFCIGAGLSAEPDIVSLIATRSEACGYHSLWAPEHIVLLDRYAPKYPYTQDGVMPFATMEVDLLDPFLALTYAAAVTRRIRLGTGICLVPERQPLIMAKEVASLDKLSAGRFDFGIGIGWLREEFDALQIPWARRAQRTRDYLAAMQACWTQGESSHHGEFAAFDAVRSYPKPVQRPHPPLIFGGESEAALKRVGEVGDGWWGVNVTVDTARQHLATIRGFAEAAGRDPAQLSYAISTGIGVPITLDEVKRFADIGIDQVIVGAFANSADEYSRVIEDTAETLIVPLGGG